VQVVMGPMMAKVCRWDGQHFIICDEAQGMYINIQCIQSDTGSSFLVASCRWHSRVPHSSTSCIITVFTASLGYDSRFYSESILSIITVVFKPIYTHLSCFCGISSKYITKSRYPMKI
jgi:hypothetical protein